MKLAIFLLALIASTFCGLEQDLENNGSIQVTIRNDAISAWVGQGWHQGNQINLSTSNPGGTLYGRPTNETLTITKKTDSWGGYTIKSDTRLWVPLSYAGYRSTVAPVAEEHLNNTRWTLNWQSANEFKLELGPLRVCRETYPSNNPYKVLGTYVGNMYAKKSGIYWDYNNNYGNAELFQVEEVTTGGIIPPPNTYPIEDALDIGPVQVQVRCDGIAPDVGSGWHQGININLDSINYGSDVFGRATAETLTITKKTDAHGGYTIKGANKLWVPYSSSGFRSSTAPNSQESEDNTRWTITFLSNTTFSLSLGPKRIMKQNYPTYNEHYLAPDYIGNLYGKYSGFFWNYESDKGIDQIFQFVEI